MLLMLGARCVVLLRRSSTFLWRSSGSSGSSSEGAWLPHKLPIQQTSEASKLRMDRESLVYMAKLAEQVLIMDGLC